MANISHISIQETIDLEELRARLRKMTDAELLRCGKDAKFMCSPGANFGKPPRECFLIALKEAREEWRRRHPPNETFDPVNRTNDSMESYMLIVQLVRVRVLLPAKSARCEVYLDHPCIQDARPQVAVYVGGKRVWCPVDEKDRNLQIVVTQTDSR